MLLSRVFQRVPTLNLQRQSLQCHPSAQTRKLNLQEYRAQKLLKDFGLNVIKGEVASTPEEAEKIAQAYFSFFGDSDLMIKAQVLAGGRGRGHLTSGLKSGIHTCTSPEEVKQFAKKMLGFNLITAQTGEEGKPVHQVYICERKYIRRETYIAIAMDRDYQGPVFIASGEGGVSIEQLAHDSPDKIIKVPVDINIGVTDEQANYIADQMGFTSKRKTSAVKQIHSLWNLFWDTDATLVEINPFAETADGEVLCLDAKLNFDPNSMYRHPDIAQMRDRAQEDPRDVLASDFDLNYIGLSGNIACLVNGAGLAMATMDLIKLHGGEPANFLDIGGGASEKQVTEAFKIITSDPKVKGILVNIFGGIMRCDVIALGLVSAAKQLNLTIPVVVRLQGTNVEKGKKIIEESGLRLIATDDLESAAEQVVKIAKIMTLADESHLQVSFSLPL